MTHIAKQKLDFVYIFAILIMWEDKMNDSYQNDEMYIAKREKEYEMLNNGTPKTLAEAIMNAIKEIYDKSIHFDNNPDSPAIKTIKNHVADFVNQHFCVAILRSDDNEKQIKALETLRERLLK